MPPTTSYKRGDILLVPFPFSDQTSAKQRPAVVVSVDAFQQHGPDLLTPIRNKFWPLHDQLPSPVAGEGEGEGKFHAHHPHLQSSPSKRRARRLFGAVPSLTTQKKIFGLGLKNIPLQIRRHSGVMSLLLPSSTDIFSLVAGVSREGPFQLVRVKKRRMINAGLGLAGLIDRSL